MSVQEKGKCVIRSIEVMTIVTPQRNFDVCTTDLLDKADQFISVVSAREGVTKISSNYWNFRRGHFTYRVFGGDRGPLLICNLLSPGPRSSIYYISG